MKNLGFIIAFSFLLSSCEKQPVYEAVGKPSENKDLEISKERAKNLNQKERSAIEEWIRQQNKTFYPMTLNYWADIDLRKRSPAPKNQPISYQYDLYDFGNEKIYNKPIKKEEVLPGKYLELKSVEDAVKYLKNGEEVTLLVPSVLAYGTYGDGHKITNDIPLMIRLKKTQ